MKILILSDTHGRHSLVPELPEADVFIHAGDFMNGGRHIEEITTFNSWLSKVPVPLDRRFICAGNHDIAFDASHPESSVKKSQIARAELTNGIYLQDEEIVVDGVKFYFSPHTPRFLNWGFNVDRGDRIKRYWNKIPEDTNVLVTHGPPYGILDEVPGSPWNNWTPEKVGCEELRKVVDRLPYLRLHAFGHIHGPRGADFNMGTLCINASFLDDSYRPHKGQGYFLVEYDKAIQGDKRNNFSYKDSERAS